MLDGVLIIESLVSYLFLGPGPVSTRRHLARSKVGGVRGGLRVHLVKRREDLGLVVKHCRDCKFRFVCLQK